MLKMSFGIDNMWNEVVTQPTSSDIIADIKKVTAYNLVITGTIGAGKSTLCNLIEKTLSEHDIKYKCYPEYLANDKTGCELLSKRLTGEISALTFQNYILDYWEHILRTTSSGINIYERCVEDSVVSFCNMANLQGEMSDQELLLLFERARTITKTYDGPSYYGTAQFIKIDTDAPDKLLAKVVSTIASDIRNGVRNRIIGICVTDEVSHDRIIERHRDGEHYDIATVRRFNRQYNSLYNKLSENGKLTRFLDMGWVV
jgi:deoxyadenosine/deoxycytidine kinase